MSHSELKRLPFISNLYSNVFFDELFSLSLGRAGLRGRRHTHKNAHRSAELSIVGHKDKVVDLIPSPAKATHANFFSNVLWSERGPFGF